MPKVSAVLITVVSVLLGIGLIVLASVSGVKGLTAFHDSQYFIKRQAIWLIFAIIAGIFTARFDYHWWRKWVIPFSLAVIFLLIIVLIPHIGRVVGGSRRWLRFGSVSFQPSEFGKFASIIALSAWIAHIDRRVARFKDGFLYPLIILGIFMSLIFLEPDYGTTILVGGVGMAVMFIGGTRITYLFWFGVLGGAAFTFAIAANPVRMKRVTAFLHPEIYPDIAYHLNQSKTSFMNGGIWGVGYGNSIQKQLYLPEAHTDFIFAILGEELGLIATVAVVILFSIILICGIIISIRSVDLFGRLLAFGITMLLTIQAALNIGVVTGCLPTKGIALPFISYGGSSLVISVAAIGVLLNIAKHNARGGDAHVVGVIKDRVNMV